MLEESSSYNSESISCELLVRRFDNPINNGLSQDEVVGVYKSGSIKDICNQAFYVIKIPRQLELCKELSSRLNTESEEILPYAHTYVLFRPSLPLFVIAIVNDNESDRLIELNETYTSVLQVLNQYTSSLSSLDDELDNVSF